MTQTTRIVLVRHGQTGWNLTSEGAVRFRGQANPPLNDAGLRQAAATARYLSRRWPVEVVYSSPMGRAMQTAQAIAKAHDLAAQPFQGLLDIDFGDWQGHSPEEVKQKDPDLLRAWFEAPHTVTVPGGESLSDVRDRVTRGLRTLVERHRGQSVAMVGHAVVNRVLLCAVLGLGNARFWRLRQDTCAVNVFDVGENDEATIVVLNDTCHLQDVNGWLY